MLVDFILYRVVQNLENFLYVLHDVFLFVALFTK